MSECVSILDYPKPLVSKFATPKKTSEVSGFASLGGEVPPYNARGQGGKVILIGAYMNGICMTDDVVYEHV